jgi:hypothetical protein
MLILTTEQLKAQVQELAELELPKDKISISKVEAETANADINNSPTTRMKALSEAEHHWTARVPKSTMKIQRMMKISLMMTWMRLMMMSHKTRERTLKNSQMSHRTQGIQMEIWKECQEQDLEIQICQLKGVVVEFSSMLAQELLSRHRTYKVVE